MSRFCLSPLLTARIKKHTQMTEDLMKMTLMNRTSGKTGVSHEDKEKFCNLMIP